MPAVQRSFYTDMRTGLPYWTFISEELPFIARSLFPLSEAREDNFVAGLSMGGYGAFKLALSHPERFAAAASFSGLMDIRYIYQDPERLAEITAVFGSLEEARNSSNDLFWLARRAARQAQTPRLYQWCGQQDFLYKNNVKFHKHAQRLGLDLTYAEGPGDHTWKYWDEQIQVFLGMIRPSPIQEG
jgi:putative tributyrin esterase